MLRKFKLGHNTEKATKNICCTKDEGTADQSTVSRWFKKFHSGCKNINDQAKSGRLRSMDSGAMFLTIEANPVSSIRAVSGKLSISQSSAVHHITTTTKASRDADCIKVLHNF